jgi:alkylation response protein AidB-like acyl-CoA dehydrogenase
MNFNISESQLMIRQMCKDFADKNIRPSMMDWDESQTFPTELFKEMGELGLMGILVPEEYGGSGLGYFEYADAIVEIARVCGSIGLSMAAHNSLCTGHILSVWKRRAKKEVVTKVGFRTMDRSMGLNRSKYRQRCDAYASNGKTRGRILGFEWC